MPTSPQKNRLLERVGLVVAGALVVALPAGLLIFQGRDDLAGVREELEVAEADLAMAAEIFDEIESAGDPSICRDMILLLEDALAAADLERDVMLDLIYDTLDRDFTRAEWKIDQAEGHRAEVERLYNDAIGMHAGCIGD